MHCSIWLHEWEELSRVVPAIRRWPAPPSLPLGTPRTPAASTPSAHPERSPCGGPPCTRNARCGCAGWWKSAGGVNEKTTSPAVPLWAGAGTYTENAAFSGS